jgi:hypothetical protein
VHIFSLIDVLYLVPSLGNDYHVFRVSPPGGLVHAKGCHSFFYINILTCIKKSKINITLSKSTDLKVGIEMDSSVLFSKVRKLPTLDIGY